MSDEIICSVGIKVEIDDYNKGDNRWNGVYDITGDAMIEHTQNIGTTEESLTLGDVATVGWFTAINSDETNYVEIGTSTGVYPIKLPPLGICLVHLNGASTIYAKANSSACNITYRAVEV